VSAADATGYQAHEDLVLAGTFHFKLINPERASRLAQHGGFHASKTAAIPKAGNSSAAWVA